MDIHEAVMRTSSNYSKHGNGVKRTSASYSKGWSADFHGSWPILCCKLDSIGNKLQYAVQQMLQLA